MQINEWIMYTVSGLAIIISLFLIMKILKRNKEENTMQFRKKIQPIDFSEVTPPTPIQKQEELQPSTQPRIPQELPPLVDSEHLASPVTINMEMKIENSKQYSDVVNFFYDILAKHGIETVSKFEVTNLGNVN